MEPYIIIILGGRGRGSGGISKKGEMGFIFTSGDSTLVYKCPLEKSVNELIEHGSIETNELNMSLLSNMTHYDSV